MEAFLKGGDAALAAAKRMKDSRNPRRWQMPGSISIARMPTARPIPMSTC